MTGDEVRAVVDQRLPQEEMNRLCQQGGCSSDSVSGTW
jgi:hypothetical protein